MDFISDRFATIAREKTKKNEIFKLYGKRKH